MEYDVTMLGTLPPITGISPYCAELATALGGVLSVEFIDFKKLYPKWLHPGKTEEEDLFDIDLENAPFTRRRILNTTNPLSWIWAGLSLKGKVVHAQWWSVFLLPVFFVILSIARLRGKRIVITIHNIEPHEKNLLFRLLNRLILPLGHEYITHSESLRDKLPNKFCANKKIHVIPHIPFISQASFQDYSMPKEDLRDFLGLPRDAKIIIFFGNIRQYKGLDVLIQAMPYVLEEHPDAVLLIAGEPWSDWERYESLIKQYAISNKIIRRLYFHPFNELRMLIKSADLAVFPFTHLDSSSGSLNLALSMGKTIVATRVGDIQELNAGNIFLAEPGCPLSLYQSISNALSLLSQSDTKPGAGKDIRELLEKNVSITVERHVFAYQCKG